MDVNRRHCIICGLPVKSGLVSWFHTASWGPRDQALHHTAAETLRTANFITAEARVDPPIIPITWQTIW